MQKYRENISQMFQKNEVFVKCRHAIRTRDKLSIGIVTHLGRMLKSETPLKGVSGKLFFLGKDDSASLPIQPILMTINISLGLHIGLHEVSENKCKNRDHPINKKPS